MQRPRPKFKVSFYLFFCCFWINFIQINFENIKINLQRIISDSCFQLKSWFNVDARAPSIPLLNFPFKMTNHSSIIQKNDGSTLKSIKIFGGKSFLFHLICLYTTDFSEMSFSKVQFHHIFDNRIPMGGCVFFGN